MSDTLILGGGVIGLSVAYELAAQGVRVRVVDRGEPGQEASWAGAGILPACKFRTRASPPEWLAGYSSQLHPQWAARLREETGIDTGYRACGGVYLAASDTAASELLQTCEQWRREGLTVKWLHAADLDAAEPALRGAYDRNGLAGGALVAEEAQLRSPRHLRALVAACRRRGVTISPGVEVYDFETEGDRLTAVVTNVGAIASDQFLIASGAWTQPIAARLGLKLAIKPMRGQIALLDSGRPILQRVINLGEHYLVPRDDGRVLVGSTTEDVGFDRSNTAAAIAGLLRFAVELSPELKGARLDRCWSGFRPATADELPYLGRVPGLANAYMAAGHFRHGLWLSPGTAVVMSRLMRGETPGVDLGPFRLDRG